MPVLGNAKVEEAGTVEETFGLLFLLARYRAQRIHKKWGIALITMLHKCHFLGLGGNWKLNWRWEMWGMCNHFSVMDIYLYFQALLFVNCKMRGMNWKGRESKYLEEAGRRGSQWSWLARVCGERGSSALSNGAEVQLLTCVPGLGRFSSFSRQATNWDIL